MKPAFADKSHNCSPAVLGRRHCFLSLSRPHAVSQKQNQPNRVRCQRANVAPVCAARSELAYATGGHLAFYIYSYLSRSCRHHGGIKCAVFPQEALPERM